MIFIAGCATVRDPRELHGEGLGSTWSVKIAGDMPLDLPTVQRGIQAQIDKVTQQLSRWDSRSALSELNHSRDEHWQTLPDGLFAALSYALSLAADTGGAYDPTVAPLVDVWGFGTQGRRYDPPSAEAINAAREHVGWAKLSLEPATHRARRPNGVEIDLSSMTHGFGADQVGAYLESVGIQRYLVDVGSEIRARGNSPDGHPWRVAIEQPPPEISATPSPQLSETGEKPTGNIRVLALRNAGVATSGNYRYFFDYDGRRYSHRIDPRTGAPIEHPLAAVTVVSPETAHADALATALTVLGPDEGFDYARRHDIAALFIVRTDRGFKERMTPRFAEYLD